MINIISKSIYQFHPSGPKKVIDNLILGLKEFNIPYTINHHPIYSEFNVIHDDKEAVTHLVKQFEKKTEKSISKIKNNKYAIGPNLYTSITEIENSGIDLNSAFFKTYDFLVPAKWVADYWKNLGYPGKIVIWPSGIQTDRFKPLFANVNHSISDDSVNTEIKNSKIEQSADNIQHTKVLLYTKGRSMSEILDIKKFLEQNNFLYTELSYGNYSEEKLIDTARASKFGILIDSSESQGIAIQELLSLNLPLVVYDIKLLDKRIFKTDIGTPATSIPYFDSTCGLVSFNAIDTKKHILEMDKTMRLGNGFFYPRDFILKNLTLKKQAEELCKILHYDIKNIPLTNSTFLEKSTFKLSKIHYWRNRTWLKPYLLLKYSVKYLLWKIQQCRIK